MTGQTPIEKAVVNPPVTIQRAVIVTQDSTKSGEAKHDADLIAESTAKDTELGEASGAATIILRPLGRQKRIIETSITPSTTPVSAATSSEESRATCNKMLSKTFDRIVDVGSPDSPLSKMNIMPTPLPKPHALAEGLLSPKSVSQLEFPMPERLLPIGQHGKDTATSLADKVREVLTTTDISHLKQESSFERSEVKRLRLSVKSSS